MTTTRASFLAARTRLAPEGFGRPSPLAARFTRLAISRSSFATSLVTLLGA